MYLKIRKHPNYSLKSLKYSLIYVKIFTHTTNCLVIN